MARRLPSYQSQILGLSILFLLTLLPVSQLQDTGKYVGEVSANVQEILTQNGKVFEDFVEIRQSVPSYASQHFPLQVDYRCKTARIITIELISYGHEDSERIEFRYNFVVALRTEVTVTRAVKVKLRDSLVFADNKALKVVTDLHTVRLRIFVSIIDISSLSLSERNGQKAAVFARDEREVFLLPPWSRPVKPGFCFSCFTSYLQKAEERRIHKCEPVNEIVNFVDFPVALTGKEEGFTKLLSPLDWKDPYLNEIQKISKPRFTITTWIYVLEACTRNLCGVIQIRNDNFLTPLVALMTSGQFHIQFNYKNKKAHAFLTRGGIRRNTWNQVIMTFNDTDVQVTVRYGDNFENEFQFEHHDFPMGSYHFDDSEGFWVLGGTGGFCSFKGFMGPTTLYRRRLLKPSEVPFPPRDHPMFNIDLDSYYSHCSSVISGLTMKMEDIAIDRRMEESLAHLDNERCQAKPMTYDFLYHYYGNKGSGQPMCDVTFTGETPEADRVVLNVLKNETINITTVGEQIYDIASKLMQRSISNIPLALSLFRVSGCTSHLKSLYTAGVIYATGLGVPRDLNKAWQYFLIGAVLDHPLCQMSLGYRFLIGGDGLAKECDISAGYYKMAAVTADKVLQEHHAVHTHSEAVRLDDYDELANHKGKDSDIFQWLVHQALQGIGDAQGIIGELYFYGKRGITRDLNKAVKYYKMSADMGNPEGLFNLGVSKLKGQGTDKNETEAMELIRKAAEKDFPPALNALGFYEVNYRANFTGAVIHFKRAADKGDRDGLNNLGVAYDNGWVGVGVPRDKKKAIDYWHKAAGKGHPGACITVGEELRTGQHTPKNCPSAVLLLRYVAEQHPEVGWQLRHGLNAYYKGHLYKSLVSYVLAGEAGMEVPQYNAALLCEENQGHLENVTNVDCVGRYYNSSAALGWVFSMIKVGDSHWYGKNVPHNITTAAKMYAEAAAKNDHPHAVYNLAYMVEYNYSLAGITWNNVDKNSVQKGNLSFAAILYQRCRDSQSNNNESYLPCAFGLVRVTIKDYYRQHPLQVQVTAMFASSLVISFGIWLVKVGDRLD